MVSSRGDGKQTDWAQRCELVAIETIAQETAATTRIRVGFVIALMVEKEFFGIDQSPNQIMQVIASRSEFTHRFTVFVDA